MSDKLKLTPILDRAFVAYTEVVAPNEVGGILLPEGFNPDKTPGIIYAQVEILAVGPAVQSIKVGQKVIVAKSQMERIAFGDHVYWLINEKAVTGIVPQ